MTSPSTPARTPRGEEQRTYNKKYQNFYPGYIKRGPGGEVSWCENGNYAVCQVISVNYPPHTGRCSVFSRLTRAHPGLVTLVALGPLTNLAIGLLADPGLGERLASLVIMGGNMEAIGNVTPSAEFNFHADPEAAHTVLR